MIVDFDTKSTYQNVLFCKYQNYYLSIEGGQK